MNHNGVCRTAPATPGLLIRVELKLGIASVAVTMGYMWIFLYFTFKSGLAS